MLVKGASGITFREISQQDKAPFHLHVGDSEGSRGWTASDSIAWYNRSKQTREISNMHELMNETNAKHLYEWLSCYGI